MEFVRTGQDGFSEDYDPRFSLVYHSIQIDEIRPCYLRSCAFNMNYAPAIGIFATNGLEVENNVVYHTLGSCK